MRGAEMHAALKDLLTILKVYHPNPPTGSRAVMKTPRMVGVVPCCDGWSIYYGLEENILQEAKSGLVLSEYLLSLLIDGLPLHSSTTKTFWPILAILDQNSSKTPFVVALFYRERKLSNSNEYLKQFVDECKRLQEKGIVLNGNVYMFHISCIIADAPEFTEEI
ncbi:hypothetical protein J437_LFUL007759 [Ladona fulva]|uniref:Uncharacterized protein n=1 Tax=Ladona fulva TaxID=123851 RepID=A0A8K0K5K7_LADFU|nr:hypothetical protein J437_LFUL007759 [Ladona fulva]